ncbi:hypothetical protein D3C86_1952140 [compost metagenome]
MVRAKLKNHRVVGRDHRQTSRNRKHAESDDERGKPDVGDEQAVECADKKRRCHGGGNANLDTVTGMHDHREDHAA